MVDYNAPLYQHPQETWDAKKCEKLAKRLCRDGCGTPYPWKGYLPELQNNGITRYNGGTVIADKWWQGEERQLPIVAEGFEIIHVSTWGYRIIKTPACGVSTPIQLLESNDERNRPDESGTEASKRMVRAAQAPVE